MNKLNFDWLCLKVWLQLIIKDFSVYFQTQSIWREKFYEKNISLCCLHLEGDNRRNYKRRAAALAATQIYRNLVYCYIGQGFKTFPKFEKTICCYFWPTPNKPITPHHVTSCHFKTAKNTKDYQNARQKNCKIFQ